MQTDLSVYCGFHNSHEFNRISIRKLKYMKHELLKQCSEYTQYFVLSNLLISRDEMRFELLQICDCLLNTTSYEPIHQIASYSLTDFPLALTHFPHALFAKSFLYIILIWYRYRNAM